MESTDLVSLFAKVAPVLLTIVLGRVIRSVGFLDAAAVEGLRKLVVNCTLPALLFGAFARTRFEGRYFALVATVFGLCILMLAAGTGIRKVLGIRNRYFPAVFGGFETGMLGYSLYGAVFGAEEMYKLAVVDLGQVTFVFFVLVSYLGGLAGTGGSFRDLLRAFFRSPVICAIGAGIAAGTTGLIEPLHAFPPARAFLDTLSLLAGLTVPLICIVIGYDLHLQPKRLGLPLVALCTRVPLLVAAAAVIDRFLVRGALGLDRGFSLALYTMFILPPPFVIPVFMPPGDGEEREFVVGTITLGVLVSLAAFLVLMLVS